MIRAAIIAVMVSAAMAFDKPWFCHKEDCPAFEVTGSTDDYEIRKYSASKWATTTVVGSNYDVALTKGFASLYKYFSGDNVNSTKLDMTTPTTAYFQTSAGSIEQNFTIGFYLPDVHQASPPLPKEKSGIEIMSVEEFTAYVVQYGGFTSESKIADKAAELAEHLEDDGIKACSENYIAASYDPPYRVTKRHNEVWLMEDKDAKAVHQESETIPFSRTSLFDAIRHVVA